jgi:hypothetical protein
MPKPKSFREWKRAWATACVLKRPAQRREALEVLLDAPIEVAFRLARAGRKLISPSLELPKPGGGGRYFFAAKVRKNVLVDAVQINVWQTRRRLRIEEILICHDITVSRTPDGSHLLRADVLAAAGTVDGHHVVNVSEYLTGDDGTDFRADFCRTVPKLREYKYHGDTIRCFWSLRGLDLAEWKSKLAAKNVAELQQTLDDLSDLICGCSMTPDVEHAVQKALMPHLAELKQHPDEDIALASAQIWNLAGFGG